MKLTLQVKLISDATFGRGDGVAGLIDVEVEYDAETGLPFLRGRVLKGLLAEECANIMFAVKNRNPASVARLEPSAKFLFGQAGSTLDDDALMHVGAATLPGELSNAVASNIKRGELTLADVLESLTAIRRQTAVDETTGAPDEGSLRSSRIVLRETVFTATLTFDREPQNDELALLAACVLSLRRGGTGRNRGRGRLRAGLNDEQFIHTQFANFQRILRETAQ
jgi:CRISPR/Cas system CMR subunit Cmr4 (Cas7 group RAMP superfamily)